MSFGIDIIIGNETKNERNRISELKNNDRIMGWKQFEDATIAHLKQKIGRLQENGNSPVELRKATEQLSRIYDKREKQAQFGE